jgi:16S rRNA C967 or C1407 C5-methylase (RsmB/RsmF family)
VYSTCTLAPGQNDGVIQAAMERVWKDTKIDVAVQAVPSIAERFRNTFRFHDACRYGQLVLPTMQNNFGPIYFCKLTRLS